MAKPTFLWILLLVVVLMQPLMQAATMAFAMRVLLSPNADVNIYNEIGGPYPLQLHCMSKDDDLGEKTLVEGQHFGWGFTPNFWGTTLFHCVFRWGPKTQHFKVWTDGNWRALKEPCRFCEWHVTAQGFFVKEEYSTEPPAWIYSWI